MRQRMLRASLVIVAVLVASAAAQSRRMELGDLGRIVRLSDPQIAPDGKSIVVVMSRANYDENRYDADLVMVDIASGDQRALTHDRRGVGQPRFSPSGDRLAFLASVALGFRSACPRPDFHDAAGRRRCPPSHKCPQRGAALRLVARRPDDRVRDRRRSREEDRTGAVQRFVRDRERRCLRPVASGCRPHPGSLPAEGGEGERLTSGSWSLPIIIHQARRPLRSTWSRGRPIIAVVRLATPHSGDNDRATIQVVDVATGQCAAAHRPRALRRLSRLFRLMVRRSRTGSRATAIPAASTRFTSRRRREAQAEASRGRSIAIWRAQSGCPTERRSSSAQTTTREGLAAGCSRSTAPRASSILEPEPLVLVLGGCRRRKGRRDGIHRDRSRHGRPSSITCRRATATPKRLTNVNAEIAALNLGRTEVITWQVRRVHAQRDCHVSARLLSCKKYPLVLVIHGGPRAASLETFAASPQIMAAKGWVVFQPNYRGSDQIGSVYQRAIVNDAGAGPGRDVMAGLEAVKQRGFVDITKIAVSGWSVRWLHDHLASRELHGLARRGGRCAR